MGIADKSLHTVDDSVRSENSQDEENLEGREFSITFGELFEFWSLVVVPFFPDEFVSFQIFNQVFIRFSDGDKFLQIFPTLIIYPLEWFSLFDFGQGLITF